jgi:hypothetical protein
MHAKMIFNVMSIGVEAGSFWRALAVAALAVSVFALNRYWQSLETHTRRVRLSLVLLRAASLLLLVGALAGVRLDYRKVTPGRVLVHYVQNRFASTEENSNRSSTEDAAIERAVASLRRSGFEPVVSKDLNAVPGVEEQSKSFAAAVLLTDAALGATAARREVEHVGAAAGDAPVFVVTDLAPADKPSVALESVMLQGRPVRGVPVTLRCTVHGRGMSGHESLLTVSDAARVQASARVTWTSDDEWQTVALEVVPKIAGWADYVARIEPAGGEDVALLTRSLTLFTEERRMRVLFFEGEPTWEAKFIRRALEQSGLFDLDYFAQVSRAATLGAATAAAGAQGEGETVDQSGQQSAGKTERAGASPEAKLHAALQSAASLNAYDLVIVGATPNAMLSAAEAARLGSFVEQRGGGLVITGGNSFAGSAPAPNGRLYALMPADVDPRGFASETQQVAQGAPLEAEKTRGQRALVPTEAGTVGPLRGYLGASEGTLSAVLTGQGLSLRGLRPGAVVLATSGQSGGGAAVNNAGGGSGGAAASNAGSVPLVAAMRYGAGRVLVFAPGDSWRIRTSATGAQDEQSGPYGALWQGIALWTAEGARPQVEIVLDTESPAVGQQVTAELRVRDAAFAPLSIERVKARLQPLQAEETGEAATAETTTNASGAQEILFVPDAFEENVWRASFIAPARGRFSLEAEFASNQERGSTEKRFAIVAPTRMEAGASTDTLRRAARSTGGEMFSADQLNNLLERLSQHTLNAQTTEQRTFELRTWSPLAFLLALLLCAEWLILRMKDKGGRMKI